MALKCWLFDTFREAGWSVGQEDASAEEIEPGPAVVLALEKLDFRDVAFDGAGAQRECESGGDSGEVLAEPVGEGADLFDLGFIGLGKPVSQSVPVAAAQDGGETAGQTAGLGDLRAASADDREVLAGLVALVLRSADDPPDDIGDRGWRRRNGAWAVVPGQCVEEAADAPSTLRRQRCWLRARIPPPSGRFGRAALVTTRAGSPPTSQ